MVCPSRENEVSSRVHFFRKFVWYWLPLLLWMAVIFTASGDARSSQRSSLYFDPLMHWLFPWMPQTQVDAWHYAFRKLCHMIEYAVLAVLAWRAIRQPVRGDQRPWRWDEAGLALSLSLLYAATDELHQVFIPTRTGQISDVLVDVVGGAGGLAVLWCSGKAVKRW